MKGAEPSGGSLLWRSVLAVGMTVCFYLLALGLVLVLVAIPWAEMRATGRLHGRLALACILGAVIILWSVAPRRTRFEAPGPRLRPGDQPRLFREIRSVAEATGQPVPGEIYLVPDLNAGVLQVGDVLGLGGRRVMVLGLPLLALLRVKELRAVLAHEFGHYHHGDTRLGSWVWLARAAIGRTVENLTEAGSLLRFVFIGYGRAFLRVTLAVSRRQERDADRLAAGVAGAAPLARGLRASHAGAEALASFMNQEVVPVLDAGFRPPIAAGLASFVASPAVRGAVEAAVEREMRHGLGSPYDSHPPLRERCEALGVPDPGPPEPGDPPALSLLDGIPALERALVPFLFSGPRLGNLKDIPWEAVAEQVYVPAWRERAAAEGPWLEGVLPAALPEALRRRIASAPPRGKPAPDLAAEAGWAAAAAVALAMVGRGWKPRTGPGLPVTLEREGRTFDPFAEIAALAAGKTAPGDWARRCDELGIASLDLGSAGAR